MYGTVAQLRIMPGMEGLFTNWMRHSTWAVRAIPGLVDVAIYQLDSNSHVVMMVCVFESRESFRANAVSPEQHADYLRMMEFLVAAPEWYDGDVIWRN